MTYIHIGRHIIQNPELTQNNEHASMKKKDKQQVAMQSVYALTTPYNEDPT